MYTRIMTSPKSLYWGKGQQASSLLIDLLLSCLLLVPQATIRIVEQTHQADTFYCVRVIVRCFLVLQQGKAVRWWYTSTTTTRRKYRVLQVCLSALPTGVHFFLRSGHLTRHEPPWAFFFRSHTMTRRTTASVDHDGCCRRALATSFQLPTPEDLYYLVI